MRSLSAGSFSSLLKRADSSSKDPTSSLKRADSFSNDPTPSETPASAAAPAGCLEDGTPLVKDLMFRMLEPRPECRAAVASVPHHPWLAAEQAAAPFSLQAVVCV